MNEILTLLGIILIAVILTKVDLFFRGKKVWSGENEYKYYCLIKTRITRRYILVYATCAFDYYKIFDKDKDGIADYKQHIYCIGRMFMKVSEILCVEDIRVYTYALQQIKNNSKIKKVGVI